MYKGVNTYHGDFYFDSSILVADPKTKLCGLTIYFSPEKSIRQVSIRLRTDFGTATTGMHQVFSLDCPKQYKKSGNRRES